MAAVEAEGAWVSSRVGLRREGKRAAPHTLEASEGAKEEGVDAAADAPVATARL